MPELRWTLLIIGVLFVVILAWWERRRPHQASRQAPHISGDTRPVVNNDPSWGPDVDGPNQRVIREPTLTLPEIRTEVRTREPTAPRELPVVEIPDDAMIGMRVEDGTAEDEFSVRGAFAEREPVAQKEPFAPAPRKEPNCARAAFANRS